VVEKRQLKNACGPACAARWGQGRWLALLGLLVVRPAFAVPQDTHALTGAEIRQFLPLVCGGARAETGPRHSYAWHRRTLPGSPNADCVHPTLRTRA
jgi:hypothetical protein